MRRRFLPRGALLRRGKGHRLGVRLHGTADAVQVGDAGHRLAPGDAHQQPQLGGDGEAGGLLAPQQPRFAAEQLRADRDLALLAAGGAFHDLGEGQHRRVCMQLLLLAAVQRGEGHVAFDQQLIAHKLAAAHLRIQPPQQQILRRGLAGRHRRLACDGALPLRHGHRQAQLPLLPPQAQEGIVVRAHAQAARAAAIAAHRPLRHDAQGQAAGRQRLRLAQQQPSLRPQHLAGRQRAALAPAGEGHALRQAAQTDALLRGVEHRDLYGAPQLHPVPLRHDGAQTQLPRRLHHAPHVRAVVGDGCFQRLLMGQRQPGGVLPAGDVLPL